MLADRVRMATFKDSLPEGYVLATDDDFHWDGGDQFTYIGTDDKVAIPHVIKGVPVTSYANMFRYSEVSGVYSNNSNVTSMSSMFEGSGTTFLDLSNFDTSNVDDMSGMFQYSGYTTLDLSGFDMSNVTYMYYMFRDSLVTTVYVRTQADADKLNSIPDNQPTLNFIVK